MGRGGIPRLIEAVAETLAVERERWVLWLPVAFGAGIAVYFALPAEPPLWLGAAVTLAVAACAGLGRRRAVVLVALLGIGAATAGFTVAQWRTAAVAEPMLSKRLGPTSVTGRIVAVERFPQGQPGQPGTPSHHPSRSATDTGRDPLAFAGPSAGYRRRRLDPRAPYCRRRHRPPPPAPSIFSASPISAAWAPSDSPSVRWS